MTIAINYSFIAHWVWNPKGWLYELGFMDCAGAGVVHITGGVASFVALWHLGARGDAVNFQTGKLKPTGHANNPIIVSIGTFLLWFASLSVHLYDFLARPHAHKTKQ